MSEAGRLSQILNSNTANFLTPSRLCLCVTAKMVLRFLDDMLCLVSFYPFTTPHWENQFIHIY